MDDDAQLLKRLADGDRAAFETIVRRHVDFVYATARRRAGDAHLAEDVTQAVFLILTQKASAIAGRVLLVGWLFRTVGHVASNATKLRRRRKHHERQAAAERSEQAMPDDAAHAETLRQLDAAIGTLRERSRDAILLRFFRKLTFAEVGHALGISDEAAKKRVTRAIEELRGEIAGGMSAAAVVAMLEQTPSSATPVAPSALSQTILDTETPPTAVAALAKGLTVTMAAKKLTSTAVVAAFILVGGLSAVAMMRPHRAAAPTVPRPITVDAEVARFGSSSLIGAWYEGSFEIVGVGRGDGSEWWSLSGERFEAVPDAVRALGTKRPEASTRLILIRESITPADPSTIVYYQLHSSAKVDATRVVDDPTRRGQRLRVLRANFPTTAPATIGIQGIVGPWQTFAEGAVSPTTRQSNGTPGVTFGPIRAGSQGATEVFFEVPQGTGVRNAVAIDSNGDEHVMAGIGTEPWLDGETRGREYATDPRLQPASISRLRVDQRPFNRWIRIEAVALEPGQNSSPILTAGSK